MPKLKKFKYDFLGNFQTLCKMNKNCFIGKLKKNPKKKSGKCSDKYAFYMTSIFLLFVSKFQVN